MAELRVARPVRIIRDLDGSLTHELHRYNVPAAGICCVLTRPLTRQVGWIASDLVTNLGKHRPWNGGGAGSAYAWAHASAWIQADGITDLVVGSAETLSETCLAELVRLSDLNSCFLWLILDTVETDAVATLIDEFDAEVLSAAAFRSRWSQARRLAASLSEETSDNAPHEFPEVPIDGISTFLSTCRHALAPEEFGEVERAFDQGFGAATELFEAEDRSEEAFAGALRAATAQSRSIWEARAVARGFQVRSIHGGYLVWLDMRRFLQNSAAVNLAWRLTDADWEKVARHGRAIQGACAVLSALGLSTDDIGGLAASDVVHDGSAVRVDGRVLEVPEGARQFLVAQHVLRLVLGDPADEAFLEVGTDRTGRSQRISRLLNDLVTATEIPFRVARAWRPTKTTRRWQHRWGIHVESIAT